MGRGRIGDGPPKVGQTLGVLPCGPRPVCIGMGFSAGLRAKVCLPHDRADFAATAIAAATIAQGKIAKATTIAETTTARAVVTAWT